MTDHPTVEGRVATLIVRYADQAPTLVDAVAMARHASLAPGRSRRPTSAVRWALIGLAATALVTALAGAAFVAGRPPLRDPIRELVSTTVTPYVGLPPMGAATSPESGQLVLSFEGRVLGNTRFHRMWVYGDGRLVWIEEGTTTGVVEQHLTAAGVDLLRSEVTRRGGIRPTDEAHPRRNSGVLWGALAVDVGDGAEPFSWTEARLPARLIDPMSWLPRHAWAEDRLRGYVPARYAVCDWDEALETSALPPAAERLLRAESSPLGPDVEGTAIGQQCARSVRLETARQIVASIEEAGWRAHQDVGPNGHAVVYASVGFALLPMTPDGQVICACG